MGWDVSDFTATENAMKEIIRTCGHLDVVVNNAGITRDGLLMSMKEEDYDRVLDVNLKGAFRYPVCSPADVKTEKRPDHQHFFGERPPEMPTGQLLCRQSGTSGTDEIRCPGSWAAGASQSMPLRRGFIETEMTEGLSEELRAKMQERIPLGHMGTAENVADAAAFLAVRSGVLHHRAGAVRGRRYVYVDRKAENMRRVVITGMGAITPLGNSVEAFWNGIKEKKNRLQAYHKNLTHRRINADWRRK